jgi:hypothetical protein
MRAARWGKPQGKTRTPDLKDTSTMNRWSLALTIAFGTIFVVGGVLTALPSESANFAGTALLFVGSLGLYGVIVFGIPSPRASNRLYWLPIASALLMFVGATLYVGGARGWFFDLASLTSGVCWLGFLGLQGVGASFLLSAPRTALAPNGAARLVAIATLTGGITTGVGNLLAWQMDYDTSSWGWAADLLVFGLIIIGLATVCLVFLLLRFAWQRFRAGGSLAEGP